MDQYWPGSAFVRKELFRSKEKTGQRRYSAWFYLQIFIDLTQKLKALVEAP
jgi:hypothetical protein